MRIDRSELQLPAPAGARVVCLKLLADANAVASRAAGGDPEGLHDFRVAVRRLRSWIRAFDVELDGAIKGKQRRRLKQIADATNPGRDLQVQLEWLDAVARHGSERRRAGAEWLRKYLRTTPDAEAGGRELRTVIGEQFTKTHDGLVDRLSEFTTDEGRTAADTGPVLGAAIGERVEPFAVAVGVALEGVHSVGDDRAAHKARIAAKRLRYLLEPVSDEVGEARELVSRLKSLQDILGRVNDAHVMIRAMREALERVAVAAARESSAAVLGKELVPGVTGAKARLLGIAPRAGILSLMRRLRADLDRAFGEAHEESVAGGFAEISGRAAGLGERLRREFGAP